MPKAKAAPGQAKPKKGAGYKFPEKFPKGEVLVDSMKKQWVLGDSIGKGGFGEIYCAAEHGSDKWSYVVKIEPHENGPLFMEKNFYIKVAKPEDVKAWKQKEKLTSLGIPTYWGSGTHTYNDNKYRFLVIDRYGQDLWSLFQKSKSFPPHTVYKLALQIIETLRYIHSKEYVHGDIKGLNLLVGLAPATQNQIFLVDFGLACKYSQKKFERDPKQAHNGTIEYTSCDWHMGVPTRRGDLEILGYNLLHWLSGSLPWEKDLTKPEVVHEKKRELMDNVETYITTHFSNIPKVIIEYMTYVSKLKHDEEPKYTTIKGLFVKELKRIGSSLTSPLDFEVKKPTAAEAKKRSSASKKTGEAAKQAKPSNASAPRPAAGKRAAKMVDTTDENDPEVASPVVKRRAAKRKAPVKSKAAAKSKAKTEDLETESDADQSEGSETDIRDLSPIQKTATDRSVPNGVVNSPKSSPTITKLPKAGTKKAAGKTNSDENKSNGTSTAIKENPVRPKVASKLPLRGKAGSSKVPPKKPDTDDDSADEFVATPVERPTSKRSANKGAANGDSKTSKTTTRSSKCSSNDASPSKRAKIGSKKTPSVPRLDYRDAPKNLRAIQEED